VDRGGTGLTSIDFERVDGRRLLSTEEPSMSLPRALLLSAVLPLAACGDAGLGVDAGAPPPDMVRTPDLVPAIPYPAPHPAPPQVGSAGGPVLLAPRIVPIFFSNDDPTLTPQIKDFVSKVGATHYWKTAVAEYDGVGAATATAPVDLTETATGTLTDADIQKWLSGKLNGNDPAFPAADDNTIYSIHYPREVTITSQGPFGTTTSCTEFGGYHSDLALDANHMNQSVSYAVIPLCDTFGGLNGIDAVTGAESHELIEAATDPYPMSNPAYGQVDDDHLYWQFALAGGEIGDMCAQDPTAFTKFPELPYTVQRVWSNKAAAAGHDPCVPALDNEVYFNTVPELNDMVTVLNFTVAGVQIPVGMSKTVTLDLFSDGPTSGPWKVKVQDFATIMGVRASLQFTLDKTSGQNGDKLKLTIKTVTMSQFGAGLFFITSTLGTQQSFYLGLVGE
jgi:hypothetical protein